MNRDVYEVAWEWILQAAESVLEDDLNEDDLPEEEYAAIIAACFEIFRNPFEFRNAL